MLLKLICYLAETCYKYCAVIMEHSQNLLQKFRFIIGSITHQTFFEKLKVDKIHFFYCL